MTETSPYLLIPHQNLFVLPNKILLVGPNPLFALQQAPTLRHSLCGADRSSAWTTNRRWGTSAASAKSCTLQEEEVIIRFRETLAIAIDD